MSSILFVSLQLFVAISIATVCVIDIFSKNKSYFPTYIALTLFIQFAINPAFIYFYGIGVNPAFPYEIDHQLITLASGVTAIFFLAFAFGFWFASKKTNIYYLRQSTLTNENLVVSVLFIISVLAFLQFVSAYGGLDYVLLNASSIRGGGDSNKNYLGAFFKMFTYFLELVVFYVFSKYLKTQERKWLFLFLFLFLLGILKSFADAGRGGMLNLLIGLFFITIFIQRRFQFLYFLILVPIILFVIIFGKTFLFEVYSGTNFDTVSGYTSTLDKIDSFLMEFSHPFLSIVLALKNEIGGNRYFVDFFIWILKPLRLLGISIPDSISYFNTYQFRGEWDSEIPPGLVAFFYYQGGLILLPIFGFITGYALRMLDRFMLLSASQARPYQALTNALLGIISIYIPFAFGNADPALFIQWCLIYLMLFVIFRITRIIKIKKIFLS